MKKCTASFGLLCSAALLTSANAAYAVTLKQTLIEAYKRSPEWAASIARKKVADESLAQSYSRWQPSVTARYNVSGSREERKNHPLPEGSPTSKNLPNVYNNGLSVTLNQNLFDGFSTINGIAAAEHNVFAARSELVTAEQQFFQRVIAAYLAVWEMRQRVEIAKKLVSNLASDLHAAEKKFEVGTGTRPEIAAAKAQLADAVYRHASAEAALEAALAQFEAVTRIKPDAQITLPNIPENLPKSQEELIKLAQQFHPAIKGAQEKALAAHNSVSSTRGGLLPRVDVEVSASTSRREERDKLGRSMFGQTTDRDTDSKTYSGNLVVSVPLLANGSGGNLYSASRRANQEALMAEMAYKKAMLDVIAECVRVWNSFKAAETQLQQSKAAVESAEVAANGARQAAKYGLKSQTDVLYYEGKLLDSRNNAVEIQKNYVSMAYTTLSLIGRLTVPGLHLQVASYNPEGNESRARLALPLVLK
ncbi:MAG: TolC family protein [Holosporales bacterium]|jgi:outer membrane protein|nr:TolC family protein [Holosporales bacterium]